MADSKPQDEVTFSTTTVDGTVTAAPGTPFNGIYESALPPSSPVADTQRFTIRTTPHLCPHCHQPTGGTSIMPSASVCTEPTEHVAESPMIPSGRAGNINDSASTSQASSPVADEVRLAAEALISAVERSGVQVEWFPFIARLAATLSAPSASAAANKENKTTTEAKP